MKIYVSIAQNYRRRKNFPHKMLHQQLYYYDQKNNNNVVVVWLFSAQNSFLPGLNRKKERKISEMQVYVIIEEELYNNNSYIILSRAYFITIKWTTKDSRGRGGGAEDEWSSKKSKASVLKVLCILKRAQVFCFFICQGMETMCHSWLLMIYRANAQKHITAADSLSEFLDNRIPYS